MAADEMLTIREATRADLPDVLTLYAEGGMALRGTLTLEQARVKLEAFARYPDYHLYVAERDGRVLGTFALLVMDNLANGGAPSGIVEDVVVSTSLRGQGVGKKMMRFAMDQCAARGCYKLVLSSNERREAAHRFYESLGFARHGVSFALPLPRRSS